MRIGAGLYKGRSLPRARAARPVPGRLKTSLFSVLAPRLDGARVLDLCAGVGGFGLEALSRGAAEVILWERDAGAVRALDAWIERVGASDRARATRRDALRAGLPDGPFDLVFLDPPFAFWEGPGVAAVLRRAVATLAAEGRLVLKLPGKMDLPGDPAWRVERHTAVASVAYALLAPAE